MSGADAVGQWRKAVDEVQRFRAAGGSPNTVAYNALVRFDVPQNGKHVVEHLPAVTCVCVRSSTSMKAVHSCPPCVDSCLHSDQHPTGMRRRSRRWRATASGAPRCGCLGACAPVRRRSAVVPWATQRTGAALAGSRNPQTGQACRRRRAGRGRGAAHTRGFPPGGPSCRARWALTRPRTTCRTRWQRPSARRTSFGSRRVPLSPYTHDSPALHGASEQSGECAGGSHVHA